MMEDNEAINIEGNVAISMDLIRLGAFVLVVALSNANFNKDQFNIGSTFCYSAWY